MEEENLHTEFQQLSDERRNELLTDRDSYNRLISEQEGSFDYYLLLINGAVFNLLLLFINNIIPLKSAIWISLFYGALSSSILSIFCVLISIKLSIHHIKNYRKILDNCLENGKEPYYNIKEQLEKETKIIKVSTWNCLSSSFLILTIIAVAIFVFLNINDMRTIKYKGEHMNDLKKVTSIANDGKTVFNITPPKSDNEKKIGVTPSPVPPPPLSPQCNSSNSQTNQSKK